VSTRRSRVALLGFGTVGSAVARRFLEPDALPDLTLTHIFDRRAALKRARHPELSSAAWTASFDDVLRSDADIVVEVVGGLDPAASWIEAALAAGKSVVTANKQVIARDGARLLRVAERQGRQLRYEAAVGGAMPIVRAIGDGLRGDRITRIVAILNGTTNAVLSRMEATGCGIDAAVREAQACGLAEADPSADLDGGDARAKLAIVCALAFGIRVDPAAIPVRSCAALTPHDLAAAREAGGAIRQIARAEFDYARAVLSASVAPEIVRHSSIFARTVGPENVAVITGEHSGDTGIFGVGAGGDATAVAVASDLLAIARDHAAVVPAPRLSSQFSVLSSEFLKFPLEVAC
jgi:homoserine dehydrogenase